MNKQIEEMARALMNAINEKKGHISMRCLAQALYNAGYRKQSEGKWKYGKENGQWGYYCTNCKAGFTGENAEWIAKSHDYCPQCGAKMKGGE